jgi:tartrate dehydratase beta subunit/fumarate hydratase class I family protein
VVKEGDGWRVTAAGPTTSIREGSHQEIMGATASGGDWQGRYGAETLAALKEHGAGIQR